MKYLTIIFLILLISCNKNEISGTEYTIIKYGNSNWTSIFKNANPTELNYKEIIEIEKIIAERVSKTIKSHNQEWNEENPNLKNTTKFRRQYVPAILENGDKVVWINFFCFEPKNDKWKSDIIMVRDGGNCFFNLKVNLTKKKYYEFYINGVAELIKNRCTTPYKNNA